MEKSYGQYVWKNSKYSCWSENPCILNIDINECYSCLLFMELERSWLTYWTIKSVLNSKEALGYCNWEWNMANLSEEGVGWSIGKTVSSYSCHYWLGLIGSSSLWLVSFLAAVEGHLNSVVLYAWYINVNDQCWTKSLKLENSGHLSNIGQ